MTGRYKISMVPLLDNGATARLGTREAHGATLAPVRRNVPFAGSGRTRLRGSRSHWRRNDPHILITASGTATPQRKPHARAKHWHGSAGQTGTMRP